MSSTTLSHAAAAAAATVPSTMKAAVFTGPGQPLTVERVAVPVPAADEVLIRVAACGVCHSDLHVLKGEVDFVHPAVLGHEVSGTVVAVGSDVPGAAVRIGTRVVAGFILPCGGCAQCLRGRDDLCTSFFENNRLRGVMHDGATRLRRPDGTALGMYSMGGLAEYAVVPLTSVAALPDSLPLAESAVLGCAGLTAYGAIKHSADLRDDESVAVVAVGGVGSNLVQLARLSGARTIIAIDIDDDKLAAARALGATHAVNSATEDAAAAVRQITGGAGVDVAFEALGRSETVQMATQLLADGGRLVLVGIAPGLSTAEVEITRLVRRSLRIIGNYGGRVRTDLPEVVRLAASGDYHPHLTVTRTYGLDEAADAFQALAEGQITGRALICP